jgi:hypothetical protein
MFVRDQRRRVPHWSVADICGLAAKVRAQFVELSSRRIAGEVAAVGKELRPTASAPT